MKSEELTPRPRKRKKREAEVATASKKKRLMWSMLGGAALAWTALGLWLAFGRGGKGEVVANDPPPAVQPNASTLKPATKDDPQPAPKNDAPVQPSPEPAAPPPPPFSERYTAKEQEQMIRAALRLVGKAAFPETDVPRDEFGFGQEDFFDRPRDDREVVLNDGWHALRMRGSGGAFDLGDAFPRAAQAVARKAPRTDFYLHFTVKAKPVSLAPIRELLGTEDSTQPGAIPISATEKLKSTWHFYGWCGIGVMDGKVIGLKADCKKVKIDESTPPPPTPPMIASKPSLDPPMFRIRLEGPLGGAAFAPGGAEFFAWEQSGLIITFDAKTGKEKKRVTIAGANDLVRATPLSPTRWLLEAGGRAQAWDSIRGLVGAIDSDDQVVDWHLSAADGGYLLTAGREVFNLRTRSKLRMLGKAAAAAPLNPAPNLFGTAPPPGHPRTAAAFSGDGRRVLWARDGKMSLFEVSTGKELHAFEEAGYVNSVALSADGSRAITGEAIATGGGGFGVAAADRPLRVWDLKTRKEVATHSRGPNEAPGPNSRSVAISPDGKRGLVCWRDERGGTALELLALEGKTPDKLLDEAYALPPSSSPPPSLTEGFNLGGDSSSSPPKPRTIDGVAFSPDGKYAISYGKSGQSGGEVRVWKLPEN